MVSDIPNRDDLWKGMTVTIEQEQENNPGEPLIGDVRLILTDENTHPEGIKVKLDSGATGRVKEVHPDEP